MAKLGNNGLSRLLTKISDWVNGKFNSLATVATSGSYNDLSNKPTSMTPSSHTHGNITNAGAIGTTANKPLITTTDGVITTGSFGTTANTFCQGNDSRLSDARTPTSHTHDDRYYTETEVDTKLNTKANDNAVVHTSGNETITGNKYFNGNYVDVWGYRLRIKNTVEVAGELPTAENTWTSNRWAGFDFVDKNNVRTFEIARGVISNGWTFLNFGILNNASNTWLEFLKYQGNASTSGVYSIDFFPMSNDTYNLGSSTAQWNNAYIKSLTINGVAAGDILTHNTNEFVDVTTAQTVGGQKIFTHGATGLGRDSYHFATIPYGKNTPPANTSYQYVFFSGNTASQGFTNSWYGGYLEQCMGTDGTARGRWQVRNTDEKLASVELLAAMDDTLTFRPTTNNVMQLGDNTRAWKIIYSNAYYLGTTAFGDIVTHNASEFVPVSDLSTVATSGSYTDLSNKPAIPSKTSDLTNDSHQSITVGTDTTSTASPAHSGTFTCVDSVTRDSNGHVTAINTKTVKLPGDNNTDTLVTQNVSTANENHPILLSATKDATANQGAKTSIFASGVKVNPSTNTITATTFSGALSGNASSATQFSANKSVTLTGDVTGTASSKAGWSVATTLADSGVTAGTYGPSADVTGNNNTTISVPQITVDAKGRVTSVVNKTLTCKNNTYTVNNKTLTIQKNGSNVATFTANSGSDVTCNITVPTNTNQLTNGAGFVTSNHTHSDYEAMTNAEIDAILADVFEK